ncbi:MAG TPA: T9SS type A sorting domain-containing protein [Flavobacterium sp.]|jgi:hypothetical protein
MKKFLQLIFTFLTGFSCVAQSNTPPGPAGCTPFEVIDSDADGFSQFNLPYFLDHFINSYFEAELGDLSGYDLFFYPSEEDANNNTNPVTVAIYTNTVAFVQNSWAKYVSNGNGPQYPSEYYFNLPQCVPLHAMPYDGDQDEDGVADGDEDVDGDLILFNDDTDADGIEDAHDTDDDNDGLATADEDYDGDGSPLNDDTDQDGIPDYRDSNVTLAAAAYQRPRMSVYPNPVSEGILNIHSDLEISSLSIYDSTGKLVVSVDNPSAEVAISTLSPGIYMVRVQAENLIETKKLVIK